MSIMSKSSNTFAILETQKYTSPKIRQRTYYTLKNTTLSLFHRQIHIKAKFHINLYKKYGRLNNNIPSNNILRDFPRHLHKHTLCFLTVNTMVCKNFITTKCVVGLAYAKKIISYK